MVEEFSQEEKAILSQFCTNTDSDVFALINLPEVVKGALFSRYSRSSKSLRRLLLDEFILNPESGFEAIAGKASFGESQLVAIKKAEEFYDRVLIGYGDDSVAELGGAHLAAERVSNLLTKQIEDSRIGISPLEKSTRYVFFDQKEGGSYNYLKEKRLMESEFASQYVEVCDLLFDTYSSLIPPLLKIEEEKNPPSGDVSERAYKASIRAKVCDILRGILPASTLTNVGLFGNGRAFEYMLVKLYSSPLSEAQEFARKAHAELSKVIPSFVKRANDKYGKEMQHYIASCRQEVQKAAFSALGAQLPQPALPEVVLVDYDKDALDKVIAAILFPHTHFDMKQLLQKVAQMGKEEKQKIISAYVGIRANRRQKPGRAFEIPYYTFSITGNFGIYRDLHRHRILTQERQLLSTKHGFDMPKEIIEAGLEDKVQAAVEAADQLYELLSKEMPYEAQYVVPLGCRMRWYIRMNLREAYHFCELRSMRQGHPDYRKVAQEIHKLILSVHPDLAAGMKFVDHQDYALERLEAEKKIDKKLQQLGQK
ncbi:MAG: FAD-dependent thymidylate synthase [Candidatus Micrarchaeota archaeon]|nr:FAD-dependent thymidylate synthase [Candidatus Micrarchaeota archaeon]